MSKSKALCAAEQRIAELADQDAHIAALEARLALGWKVCRDQRTRIAELEAKLATRGVIAAPAPVVTHFTKSDGSVWQKTRTGSYAVSRQVS